MTKLILIAIIIALSSCGAFPTQTSKSDTNESVTYKKEWHGETGYVNCLLVSMSRLSISRVNLHTSAPLPNLTSLTVAKPDTNKWIKAQDFQYDQLDQLTTIRILAELSGITADSKRLTGTISILDIADNDKNAMHRVFDIKLSFIGDELALAVIQRTVDG